MHGTPHDALFKAAFSDLGRAAEELRYAVGPELAAAIDFSTLALESGSFVDEALRERHTDRLYSATLAGQRALIYVLFEHQSTEDPFMPLRLLGYLVRIWEAVVRAEPERRRLPVILPVVLHHGERGWRADTRFESLLEVPHEAPAALWAHVPRFGFVLDDLAAVGDEELRHRAMSAGTRLVLFALQQTRTAGDIVDTIRRARDLIHALQAERSGEAALRLVFRYILEVRGPHDRQIIDAVATEVGRKEAETMQTIADALREEGRQEGEREGERKILVRIIRRRFGKLPAHLLARIEAADLATLERWSERLLDARGLDELLDT